MHYSAAIDLSGHEAAFAVTNSLREVIISEHCPMGGRTSAGLSSWLAGLLTRNNIALADIVFWTAGSGPGNFTGMRLAAALVGGITCRNSQCHTRCVPTAVALAMQLSSAPGEKITAFFDGRNNELIAYSMINRGGVIYPDGEGTLLHADRMAAAIAVHQNAQKIAFCHDAAAIGKIIPPNEISNIQFIERIMPENLIFSECVEYNDDLTDLIYIRPAVATRPAEGA